MRAIIDTLKRSSITTHLLKHKGEDIHGDAQNDILGVTYYYSRRSNKSNMYKKLRKIITTRPREDICKPLVCIKSVNVLPSTGESSREPKSAT